VGSIERGKVLHEAALAACEALRVDESGAREYLCGIVPELRHASMSLSPQAT
jgi:hypothetical protein